jgi:excisionase family DNA binding protein
MHHEIPVPPREGSAPSTTVELAARLGVSRHAVVYHIYQGHIAAERHGRDWMIPAAEADRVVATYRRQQSWPADDGPGRQLGDRVKAARVRRGWTQRQLASHAQLSHSCVARVERGVDMATLAALAEALGVPVAELAGQEAQSA